MNWIKIIEDPFNEIPQDKPFLALCGAACSINDIELLMHCAPILGVNAGKYLFIRRNLVDIPAEDIKYWMPLPDVVKI